MRAWLMDSYQGIDKLRLGEMPDPQPGPTDVLVKVTYAALNPADAFLAQGLYPAKPTLPHILGRDGVGEVEFVGSHVGNINAGETVGVLRCEIGVEIPGTLAEKVVVPAESLVSIPAGWSLAEMAGAPLVFLTAWQALTQWSNPPAPLAKRSVLLVTGASGGVGLASVLLGQAMDLIIVALSRDAEKRTKLKALGADFVFDPEDRALVKSISAAISPKKWTWSSTASVANYSPHHRRARPWRTDQRRRQERRHCIRVQYGDLTIPPHSHRRGFGWGL